MCVFSIIFAQISAKKKKKKPKSVAFKCQTKLQYCWVEKKGKKKHIEELLLQLWRDLQYLFYCTGQVPTLTYSLTHTHIV